MTTEIEKQFFNSFGIKPKIINTAVGRGFYIEHNRVEKYPQITDRILLELICICNNTYKNGYTNYFISTGKTVEEIKKEILKKCIFIQDDTKHRVQALFREEQDEET